ncbi:glycine-rich family protein [Salix suchowensis]|nr:glycine-rich family protein [Salix suchowensis]
MKPKSKAHTKTKNSNSLWKWNANDSKKKNGSQFPVPEFLQESYRQVEETTLGPGGGFGIGCGIGAGFGLVGGLGYGGWPWNSIKLVVGVGMGCGVGFGFGYGNGFGHGFSLDSLESYFSKRRCRNIIASRFEMPALLRILQKQLQSIELLKASKRSPLVDLTNMTMTEENIVSMELAIQQR